MAGTRRLMVVTAFTVTGLLFGGGSLRAFADDKGGGDRGGDRHDAQRHLELQQPQVHVVQPAEQAAEAEHHGHGNDNAANVVNGAGPQVATHGDDDHHGRGGGDGDDHRGPSVNAGPGHHEDEDENENEHERTPTPTPSMTATPTPSMTATPTATGVVTMTPTATPVAEEEEEELVTEINGVVFQCEPTDNGEGKDRGRHLGQVKHEDEEAFVTEINGIQFICEAEEEDED
jgi:hypothetical protein